MRLVVGTEIVEKKDRPVWITIALSITKGADCLQKQGEASLDNFLPEGGAC